MNKILFATLISISFFTGCKKNPETPSTDNAIPVNIGKAVYVLNEGLFGHADGARLTLYDYDTKTVYTDVFEKGNNGRHLGDTGDDMLRVGNRLYLLMSGSKTIKILHLPDHQLVKSDSFPTPRSPHDLIIDTLRHHLFFTNLFAGSVTVTNDTTLEIIKDVTVGANPQGLALKGDQLFVCNSGYSADSTVSVINLNTLLVVATVVLSKGPTNTAISHDGNLVVSCTGDSSVKGSVFVINPANYSIIKKIDLTTNLFYNDGTMALDTSGNAFVIGVTPASFYGGPIHKINLATGAIVPNYLNAGVYYGISVDPYTNELFVSDVKEFNEDGIVSIVSPDGSIKSQFTAQRGPSVFNFRW